MTEHEKDSEGRIVKCGIAGYGECCFGIWQSPHNPNFFSVPFATDPDDPCDDCFSAQDYGVCELFLNPSYISKAQFEEEIDWTEERVGISPDCPIAQGEITSPVWKQEHEGD